MKPVQEPLETLLNQILKELREIREDAYLHSKPLLNIEDTAKYLGGISPKTIRNGLGPKAAKPFPVKPVKVGGRVVFRREDLDAYIESISEGR